MIAVVYCMCKSLRNLNCQVAVNLEIQNLFLVTDQDTGVKCL